MQAELTKRACQCCKTEKELSEFGLSKRETGGINPVCKTCNNARSRSYNKNHGDRRRIASKTERLLNPQLSRDRYNRWSGKPENAIKRKAASKLRYQSNKAHHIAVVKKYLSNPLNAQRFKVYRKRYEQTPTVKVGKNLRRRVCRLLGKSKGSGRSFKLLGLPNKGALLKYLESKFKPGMTWENYGFYGWHIDHIKPLSRFDLTDPEQVAIAFHYTNLQPLWWYENMSKGNRVGTN